MNLSKATNKQLFVIINNDKDCPTHLLSEIVEEMINRNQWESVIKYSLRLSFKNTEYVIKRLFQMEFKEVVNIANAEIYRLTGQFKQGFRTFKTFVISCLSRKFKKMLRDTKWDKRFANQHTVSVDNEDEKLQTKLEATIFKSPVNVERTVINKIMLENAFKTLNDKEKRAVELEQTGYSQYDISRIMGFKNERYGNTLLRRTYRKLRKELV